jgi:hypothetical protein
MTDKKLEVAVPVGVPQRSPQPARPSTEGKPVRIVTMGPHGMEEEPRANTVISNVTTVATGALAVGLAAVAALPAGVTAGVVALGVAAIGGVASGFIGQKIKLGEPDVLIRHPDGALYITVKFHPTHDGDLDRAIEEVRRYARERANVLYLGIRRTDRPGHPYVLQWQRKVASAPFGEGEWMPGSTYPPLERRREGKPPSDIPAGPQT